jgi:ergothioneine biosynthesis protein EgtB
VTTATNQQVSLPSRPAADERSFCRVRSVTQSLADPLSVEDQVVQSMPEASPTKWHLGHTTWFFDEFVLALELGNEPDPAYRFLFNSYYEGVGDRQPRAERGLLTRPSGAEVADFRARVDDSLAELLRSGRISDPGAQLVELGLHHEQQHQELLLMDAKHLLSRNHLQPTYLDRTDRVDRREPKPTGPAWISHGGGLVDLGHSADSFSYDNETPEHASWLQPFELADRLVTNGEWLDFISDGGYEDPALWLSDGWAMVQDSGWDSPLYWGADRQVFTLHGPEELNRAEPVVHISYYEADAYARWAGASLPTEAEWEVVAREHWTPPERGAVTLHPSPKGSAGADPLQFCGEVWQWTSSAYLPYPGFVPAAGAVGEYNGKFMVNQHVLRGGACVTPPGHERVTYRNFFVPAARWPFTGLRLARG